MLANVFNRLGIALETGYSQIRNLYDLIADPAAARFFQTLIDSGFDPNAHIDVLPWQALIYVCVPKSASTTIKAALTTLQGNAASRSPEALHTRRRSGLRSPAQIGIAQFYRLATSSDTLRFTFVRNPYSRLVSAWANKYRGKPLVRGDSFVDLYLANRKTIDATLPKGASNTLSFPQFVTFAAATADRRLNAHWHLQDDLVSMPGIALDFVGKVESFHTDFNRVLDHAGADERLRQVIAVNRNTSRHAPWQTYYDQALAERVYRAYRQDFERFGYSRTIEPNL
jgi:hypothetical protein